MEQIPDHPMIRRLEATGEPWPVPCPRSVLLNFGKSKASSLSLVCPRESEAKEKGIGEGLSLFPLPEPLP